jgi:hypothetical protein
MSLPRPFSQCTLSDLAPAISADASTASARALDPATASRLLPALRNAALTEAVLLRHPLVRDRSGLKCDGSVYSKRAWCGMLRDLAGAAGVDASDAALTWVYLVCKECAMQGGVHVSAEPPPPAPSFKFEYDDRFLGRLMRIPPAQLRQVDAPLQLMHALSCAFVVKAAGNTPIPRLGMGEGTKPVSQCGGGNVRHRFLAFPQRAARGGSAAAGRGAARAPFARHKAFKSRNVGLLGVFRKQWFRTEKKT